MKLRVLQALLLGLGPMLLLPGCRATRVVIADPNTGFRSDGERSIRLQLDRVQLSSNLAETPLCFECSNGGESADPPKTLGFKLQFFAVNELEESWAVRTDRFALESKDSPELEFQQSREPGEVLITVPPDSTARFSVWLSVQGSSDMKSETDLYGNYRLRFRDEYRGSDGQPQSVRLERHLSVGEFDQQLQMIRFLGGLTLALVVMAAL